ncbi:L-ascorbate oxidase [Asimina triloba]
MGRGEMSSGIPLPLLVVVLWAAALATAPEVVKGEDPYLFFEWKVTWGTISPLGTPQQVILINGEFPGPNINSTSNNNIVVNVFNDLNEPLLFTWHGIQQRKNSWMDGTPGTQCPIPPGTNYTYHFQVKDQIGSYYYFPSTSIHRAAGGFGGLRINSRLLIPVPFDPPADDYTVLIGDWYAKGLDFLKSHLDSGRSIGRADGLLINGQPGKGDGSDKPMFEMEAGKTYRYRFCNVGLKNSFNVRIQGHQMKLVEMEGSHTVQNVYNSLDIHLGQCLSVLVTADQEPKSYYIAASTRFTKTVLSATAVIHYKGSTAPGSAAPPPSSDIPTGPIGWAWSLNQFRSFRWNLTASAARPNPQGSYHYGNINITRTIRIANSAGKVDGKLRYAVNGASFTEPDTPLKLAEYYSIGPKVFEYNAISDDPSFLGDSPQQLKMQPIVVNGTFRDFVEIIFENREKSVQSWHLNGYSFFAVGMEPGRWAPEKRKNYNLLDAVSRHTIQVYPNSWTAVMLTLDNAGMWNLRSQTLERQYLGQQLYLSLISPGRSLRDEYNMPDGTPVCGLVQGLPIPAPYSM